MVLTSLDRYLLDLLACPVCRSDLAHDEAGGSLRCRLRPEHVYRVVEGIPDFVGESEERESEVVREELADWELNAEFYLRDARLPWQDMFLARMLANYGPLPDGPSLDVGAGSGQFAAKVEGCIAADISLGMARIARNVFGVPAVRCHADALPFRDGAFRKLFFNNTLHHMKGQGILAESVEEATRVVAPDGVLCVTDRNPGFVSSASVAVLAWGKGLTFKVLGRFPGCGTTNEPPFGAEDYAVLDKRWRIVHRRDWRTLLTYVLTVATHLLSQLLGWGAGLRLQTALKGAMVWLEANLAFGLWCTETSLTARRR